jgi:hypothetical protein
MSKEDTSERSVVIIAIVVERNLVQIWFCFVFSWVKIKVNTACLKNVINSYHWKPCNEISTVTQ